MQRGNMVDPWCRLHASSWVVGVLVLLFFTLWNVSAFFAVSYNPDQSVIPIWKHGWPASYLTRTRQVPVSTDIWALRRNVRSFDGRLLSLDVCLGLATAAMMAFAFEWRRRRRPRLLSLSTKDLLALTIVVAAVMACWYRAQSKLEHVRSVLQSFAGPGSFFAGDQRLPAWLWNWLPDGTVKLSDTNLLVQISLTNSPQTQLEELSTLSDVTAVYFQPLSSPNPIQIDEHVEYLARMKQLKVLGVRETDLSDEGFGKLSGLTRLQFLTVGDISDVGMQTLSRFPRLESLGVGLQGDSQWTSQVSDAGMSSFQNLRDLKWLEIHCSPLSKEGTEYLSHLDKLEDLRLYSDLKDESLEPIGRTKALKILILNAPNITDAGLAHLFGLSKLQYLINSSAPVGDRGLESLSAIESLTHLSISCSMVTDNGIPFLLRMRALENINLRGSQITDASIETLAKIPNLRQVYLTGTKISPEGIAKLKAARPELFVVP